uniref:Ubiquitin-like domain-containing protein n=1 Tax=Strombidinopsis acuminata TaxID=141414 RepID=A0A7S3W9Y3_9SPIT|mmetsp:Transcript_2232/g.2790  ORF Transcript_2232/g.2790 Transcript_2232/m.2790 type:complete len:147 (+) Transcript_2232:1-441(+)
MQRTHRDQGWALVKGPGFGVEGPLLLPASGNDEDAQAALKENQVVEFVRVRYGMQIIFEVMVPRDATVAELMAMLSARTGLKPWRTILTKALPPVSEQTGHLLPYDYTSNDDVLDPKQRICDIGLQADQPLNLIYLGTFDADFNRN